MITQEAINRGGSKLEITIALLESGVDVPIPRSTWKYYDQSLDPVLPEFHRMKKPVIVRGSHPNDYHGFIDIVPTHRNVETVSELEAAVKDIEEQTAREGVRIHCKDWGQPFTPEVHILIQEQSTSPIVGSMIRHPHDRVQMRIQYLDITDTKHDRPPVSAAMVHVKGGLDHQSNVGIGTNEIRELIEMYEKLEACGVLDSEWAQQVEFGLRPLNFYQARPFKRFQPAQDFEIPYMREKGVLILLPASILV